MKNENPHIEKFKANITALIYEDCDIYVVDGFGVIYTTDSICSIYPTEDVLAKEIPDEIYERLHKYAVEHYDSIENFIY